MKKKEIIIYIFLVSLFLVLFACKNEKENEVINVDFSKTNSTQTGGEIKQNLTVAVSAMISPQETFRYYQQLLDYISKKTGMTIILKQRKTYQEVNNLLKLEELDMAFICSGAYIETQEEDYVNLLVVPLVKNKPYYYAYIIVHKESSIQRFADLKGHSFAFTDILSNTGRFYPLYLLSELNTKPKQFFSKTIFTYAHDNSIHAVSKKIVDGASVDSLIFDYIRKNKPHEISNIKIIKKSQPFGIPPVVVKKNIDPEIKQKLQSILTGMDKDPEGRNILNSLMINQFIFPDEQIYNSIKKMKLFFKKKT